MKNIFTSQKTSNPPVTFSEKRSQEKKNGEPKIPAAQNWRPFNNTDANFQVFLFENSARKKA